jgi:hypothetical protein
VHTKVYFASLRRGKLRSRSFQGLREIFPSEEPPGFMGSRAKKKRLLSQAAESGTKNINLSYIIFCNYDNILLCQNSVLSLPKPAISLGRRA